MQKFQLAQTYLSGEMDAFLHSFYIHEKVLLNRFDFWVFQYRFLNFTMYLLDRQYNHSHKNFESSEKIISSKGKHTVLLK